ncbi:hypothetical protein ACFPRL_27370 [Pseudoclavibacter helvolus]
MSHQGVATYRGCSCRSLSHCPKLSPITPALPGSVFPIASTMALAASMASAAGVPSEARPPIRAADSTSFRRSASSRTMPAQ